MYNKRRLHVAFWPLRANVYIPRVQLYVARHFILLCVCAIRTATVYSQWVAAIRGNCWARASRIKTHEWNERRQNTYGTSFQHICTYDRWCVCLCMYMYVMVSVSITKCENLLILMNSAKWLWAALKIDIVRVSSLFTISISIWNVPNGCGTGGATSLCQQIFIFYFFVCFSSKATPYL